MTTYERKRKTITTIDSEGKRTSETFDFINQAKRASRKIQEANGGLGCGVLRVVIPT